MVNSVPDQDHYLTSPKIPNFFTWVEIDNKPVQVYAKTQQGDGKVIGYIEAVEGKEFQVRYADLRTSTPNDSYISQMYLDGTFCRGHVSENARHNYRGDPGKSWRYKTWSGKRTSRTTEQLFLFGKLQTTDDNDAACSDENVIKNLGTIQVRYRRVENIRTFQGSEVYDSTEAKPIHEQSKKARLSHQAAFGETKEIGFHGRSDYDWIDSPENPLQVYEFRYRSRQLLQLEGHIPNSPQPSNHSSPATGDTLDSTQRQEEIARLKRRLEALEKETSGSPSPGPSTTSDLRKVKAEISDEREQEKVKVEKGAAPSTSTQVNEGKGKQKEVIVLSDSD